MEPSIMEKSPYKVPLIVRERTGSNLDRVVVSNGIPLPMGSVFGDHDLTLENEWGEIIHSGFYPLQKWQDGSWRFVLANFLADLPASSETQFSLVIGDQQREPISSHSKQVISVQEDEEGFTVITGPLKFTAKKEGFNVIDQAWIDDSGEMEFTASHKVVDSHNLGITARIDGISYSITLGSIIKVALYPKEGTPPHGNPVISRISFLLAILGESIFRTFPTLDVLTLSSPFTIATIKLFLSSTIQIFFTKSSGDAPTASAAS